MGHPISTTYLDLQTARASAALAAAGAWDAAPTELSCPAFGFVTLSVTYTRAAAGGAVDLQLQTSPYSADQAGVEDWFTQSLYAAGVVAGGADTQSREQREFITYQATGAGAENFPVDPVELRGTVERLRVRCRESGAVANPGTCHIVANFGEG